MTGQKSKHGYAYCLCVNCATTANYRRHVKKLRRRELRNENKEIIRKEVDGKS